MCILGACTCTLLEVQQLTLKHTLLSKIRSVIKVGHHLQNGLSDCRMAIAKSLILVPFCEVAQSIFIVFIKVEKNMSLAGRVPETI